jgi:O-acetylserine/cysteine efflux transporter
MPMRNKDIGLGLIVVTIWGLNFIAIKVGLQDMPPLLLGAIRFFVVAFPALFFIKKPPVPWVWLIALGLTINVGQFAFLFMGIKYGMPAGLASLTHQSQAFFTLGLAVVFLGEHWRWNHVLGLILAAIGMAIIGLQQNTTMTAVGFWLVLVAAFSWAAGNVIIRQVTQGVPPFSILALVLWSGAVAVIPLALLSLVFEGPAAWSSAFQSFSWSTAASLIYLAYAASLVGYWLWGKLLFRYPAATVSPFALLVPIIGMSSSVLFLNESLSLWQLLGAILVMAGLAVNVFGSRWIRAFRRDGETL